MTTIPIETFNLVQCICLRPRMYTEGGTLGEVLALVAEYAENPRDPGGRRDDSPARTIAWLDERLGTAPETADRRPSRAVAVFGGEAEVFAAVEAFAKEVSSG